VFRFFKTGLQDLQDWGFRAFARARERRRANNRGDRGLQRIGPGFAHREPCRWGPQSPRAMGKGARVFQPVGGYTRRGRRVHIGRRGGASAEPRDPRVETLPRGGDAASTALREINDRSDRTDPTDLPPSRFSSTKFCDKADFGPWTLDFLAASP
jgi:hypothetical protein